MKYNDKAFYSAVNFYKEKLKGKIKDKLVFVIANIKEEKAFFSLAPLSMAIHELEGDLHVIIKEENEFINYKILKKIWYTYDDFLKGIKTDKVKALMGFIGSVDKRTKTKVFRDMFKKPELILKAKENGFTGTLELPYKSEWHSKYRFKDLLETAKAIWKQGYDLKSKDRIGISFVLMPKKQDIELPVEDYLDSYSIAWAMANTAKDFKTTVYLSSSTDRASRLAKAVRSVDLMATLKGCELEKNIKEEVFQKYKKLSKLLKMDKMSFVSANFGIHAKGYFGRHFFGERIGYPTPNKKSRWNSPGEMMLKDRYSPQARDEPRPPLMRHAITETLPIDIFIETCNVDYPKLRKRSEKVRDILNKCKYVRVIGKENKVYGGSYKTDFGFDLLTNEGKRRKFTSHDSEVNTLIDLEFYKETGIKAGNYANFPSGEAFVCPENLKGQIVGDVVINVGQSRMIPKKTPIILHCNGSGYKILNAPSKIHEIIKKELKEARQKIHDLKKNESTPKSMIEMFKKNFKMMGEFAINTNPKAKVCNYLIVNEKIAHMIHVAMGSGFEPDRKTVYHWDIVIDSPRQKLDIYGVDEKGIHHWIHKKGRLVV